jgi:predicted RNA-binding Zn ribbon-like protein
VPVILVACTAWVSKVTEPVFELSAGALALDFANSIEKRPLPQSLELLNGYPDLVAWAAQARVVDGRQAERLRLIAGRRAIDARRVFRRAIRLREAIFGVFSAITAGHPLDESDLDTIRQEVLTAYQHARLARGAGAFHWEFHSDTDALDSMLWAIARNAVDLLADREALGAVRECASDRCAWLFLDRSRNRTRRWCDMKICGNRAKSRRHYRRTRLLTDDQRQEPRKTK